ncbi:MAG: hypothetical protein ACI9D0_000663 [Bacteroidia bacterium]
MAGDTNATDLRGRGAVSVAMSKIEVSRDVKIKLGGRLEPTYQE